MHSGTRKSLTAITFAICALFCIGGSRPLQSNSRIQVDTPFSNWRPTNDTQGIRNVGSKACVQCHTVEAAGLNTSMAHALEAAGNCKVLSMNERLLFRNGPFSYELSSQGNRPLYTVSDGVKKISEPILYCFGEGRVGQTYVFRHNGSFYETRVSYFREIRGLDFTIGHSRLVPTSVEDALGREIAMDEAKNCFGCHTTGAVNGSRLQLDQLSPGVGCEACHGPGEKHIAAVKAEKLNDLQIFNPRSLSANDLTQSFCGTCHTSFEQAMLMPGQSGINNIRFQPYRMFNSPGHNKDDHRISCTACHDPHEQLEKAPASYDSKCLACHLTLLKDTKTALRSAPACPVSTQRCVTCHMPKVELPGMHAKFTDHWIRTVKAGAPVPR